MDLNVIFIGRPSFPKGGAMTKRWRYLVDYLNQHSIESHVLITDYKKQRDFENLQQGSYEGCTYYNLSYVLSQSNVFHYWKEGINKLQEWKSTNKKNILIFNTIVGAIEQPFYRYAIRNGYFVVLDQVETSYRLVGNNSRAMAIYQWLSELFMKRVYKKVSSFVISKRLWDENVDRNNKMKLCLLPNSTPVLSDTTRHCLNHPLKILYSGTYGKKEGVGFLIDGVLNAICRGYKCELFLLGKGAPKDMEFLEDIKNNSNIHYLGFVSDENLLKLQLECDVLCMVRTNTIFANYGFPFKLSEYLATGNIVLATKVGDVEDYLKDKENAYIIEPENSTAVANAIIHIIENPEEAFNVAYNGQRAMKQHFSINTIGNKFVSFLNEV